MIHLKFNRLNSFVNVHMIRFVSYLYNTSLYIYKNQFCELFAILDVYFRMLRMRCYDNP
jgi:hypothetical protein